MEGDLLPGRRPVADLRPRRQPDGRDDGPGGAGHAQDRPVHQQRQPGADLPGQDARTPHGTWGSTQATILSLKALVAGVGRRQAARARPTFTITVNGKEAAKGEVTEENADVMQLFDLKEHTQAGRQRGDDRGEGRDEPDVPDRRPALRAVERRSRADKPVLDVAVDYDRTKLSTADLLQAKATLKYNGEVPTYMVIVDLGIPPGFTVDAGDFAEMVAAKKVQKFSVTARQVTLYLGDVKPGDVKTFEYTLKPKYPIKAKTPATVAYEYYTPANRATAQPVELIVDEKK